jgi:hypothetical protein
MAALDKHIDELYAQPLEAFTAARNALAKTLSGADAAEVKRLKKPAVAAWAVNQLYWHRRPVYDRLMKSGSALRKTQIAALEGKKADLREATSSHREAIAEAVQETERLAEDAGSRPSPDALMRTLEALSLAPRPPAEPGRLTEPLAPSGFEALAGVSPAGHVFARAATPEPRTASKAKAGAASEAERRARDARAGREEHEAARRAAAEEKRRDAAVRHAEAALTRAQAAERLAHDAWLRAQEEVDAARQRLSAAKSAR